MNQVIWTERYVELGGCGDPSCCGQDYWEWRDGEYNSACDTEEATRTTAQDHGMKDAFEWQTPRQACVDFLKELEVELVFIEEDIR